MAYVRPTLEAFVAIFPAFAAVTQDGFDYWIERAEGVVGTDYGDDQLHATQLLTAHYLVQQGLGSGVDSQRWREFAGANRVKSGSLELGWADGSKSTGSAYGDAIRGLAIANKGGPCVTGTGTIPTMINYGGYYGPA